MDARVEAVLKLLLCIGAVAVLARRHRWPGRLGEERAGVWLAAAAVIAALAYTNFGQFSGWPPLHKRELFHYFLGSKYYPELRYDGLYVASLGVQWQNHPELGVQPQMRDLRTNRVVPIAQLEAPFREVRVRFDDARWNRFESDHDYFTASPGSEHELGLWRLDHGYNPSPTWSFVARLLSSWLPAGSATFLLLASLDLLLLGGLALAVWRTFGGRIGAMVVLLLGLGAPWRYDWVGGAFLRADWIAALGCGICALKRERFALAGVLIGYAAMVRIFPAAFLVGPAVVAARELIQGRPPRWFLRLSTGALAAAAAGLLAGGLTGGGFAAWPEFAHRLSVYRERVPPNGIGLTNAILVDRAVALDGDGHDSLSQYDERRQAGMLEGERRRRAPILAASLLLIGMTLAAMWNRPPHEAAVLGSALLFAALSMANYYWIVLALVPLAGERWLPSAGVLGLSAFVFAMILATEEALAATYGAASWALLLLLALWLAPSAWATLRTRWPSRPTRATDPKRKPPRSRERRS